MADGRGDRSSRNGPRYGMVKGLLRVRFDDILHPHVPDGRADSAWRSGPSAIGRFLRPSAPVVNGLRASPALGAREVASITYRHYRATLAPRIGGHIGARLPGQRSLRLGSLNGSSALRQDVGDGRSTLDSYSGLAPFAGGEVRERLGTSSRR